MYLKTILDFKIYVCARVKTCPDRRQERDLFVERKHRPNIYCTFAFGSFEKIELVQRP